MLLKSISVSECAVAIASAIVRTPPSPSGLRARLTVDRLLFVHSREAIAVELAEVHCTALSSRVSRVQGGASSAAQMADVPVLPSAAAGGGAADFYEILCGKCRLTWQLGRKQIDELMCN